MPTRTDLQILPESSDADEGDVAARCPLCHPYLSMLNIANCKAILQVCKYDNLELGSSRLHPEYEVFVFFNGFFSIMHFDLV